ncbi:MAG TPA: hypothetical protein V6C57_01160 [Coleofasciculaceae cyanobacterium]
MTDPATEIEEAIITRLDPLTADGIYVRNRAQSHQQAKAQAQLIIVLVSGRAIATQPKHRGAPIHQSLSFQIIAEFQNQRTHAGAYPVIYQVGGHLQGFIPQGAQAGAIAWNGFNYQGYSEQSKIYQWSMDFSLPIEFKLPRAV